MWCMCQFCAVSCKHGGFNFVVNVCAFSIVHKGFDFVVNACALPFEDVALFFYVLFVLFSFPFRFLFVFSLFSHCFILRADHIGFLIRQQTYYHPRSLTTSQLRLRAEHVAFIVVFLFS
jgi:hypothetical protein